MKLNDLEKLKFSESSRLSFDHDLSRLNWFNIGGKSKIYFLAGSLKDLSLFLKTYHQRGKMVRALIFVKQVQRQLLPKFFRHH